jgi:hypothetical protein
MEVKLNTGDDDDVNTCIYNKKKEEERRRKKGRTVTQVNDANRYILTHLFYT